MMAALAVRMCGYEMTPPGVSGGVGGVQGVGVVFSLP